MQLRQMSLIEAITNVVVGFGVALLTRILVFPLFGLQVSLGKTSQSAGSSHSHPSPGRTPCAGPSRRSGHAVPKRAPPGMGPAASALLRINVRFQRAKHMDCRCGGLGSDSIP